MRFSLALGLAALAATANATIAARQRTAGSAAASDATPTADSSPTTSTETTSTSSTGGSPDSTVVITTTVTGEPSRRSTTTTTVGSTVYTTLTSYVTDYSTTTVTSSDQDTATSTVWSTTTVQVNRRGLDGVVAPATPTPAAGLAKRDTTTVYTTVTVIPSSAGVVTVTETQDVFSTTSIVTTTTSVETETVQLNARTTTTVTSTRTVSQLIVTQTRSTEVATSTGQPSNGSGSSDSNGLSTGAKAGIGAGVGVAGLAVIAGLLFCCFKRRRSPKADPDMMAGASEVPVGPSSGGRPMSHASSAAFASVRTPVKPSPEGYRGTAMGDGRAGYAKPDPYGSSYGPSRSTTTTTQPPTRNSGGHGPDSLPEHPVPGSENTTMLAAAHPRLGSPAVSSVSPAPSKQEAMSPSPMQQVPPQHFAHELGTDNMAAAKWYNEGAAEIDSQPVMAHQSGPVYEMPTETYR